MRYFHGLSLVLTALIIWSPDTLAQTADCDQVNAESILNANGVRAKIMNNGGLFWNNGRSVYTVDGSNALFNANLLLGGIVDGEVRTAGTTYGPYEFWPGPADNIQTAADCERFNRMYRIALRDVNAYEDGAEAPDDLLDWPWQHGAPVIDGDGNPNNYNLAGGDRPEILGSEMIYWIMNDVGGVHERTGTAPLGIEVHGTAFAVPSSDPAFDNATFYRYRIINRSDRPIEEAFTGFYVDPDLGAAFDDYAGSDSLSSLAFAYNADNDDDGNYGLNPPAVGFRTFHGPVASPDGYDNDYDGVVDEPGERLRMSYYVQPQKSSSIAGEPRTGTEFYRYMQGIWRDGMPVTEGGDGRETGKPIRFMFPGDPPEYWSEVVPDESATPRAPADRRWIHGVGPFRLAPGEETELFFGVLYARAENNLASRDLLESYALEMDGLQPEDISSNIGQQPVTEAPRLTSPVDESVNNLSSVTFDWASVNNGLVYQVELERLDEPGNPQLIEIRETETTINLERDARYSWRVRAWSATHYGPWSESRTVATGPFSPSALVSFADAVVVENAAGPLAEPVGATADWRGFPGSGPPHDSQQVGPARWLIHSMNGDEPDEANFEHFLSRSFRNWTEEVWGTTYEIRFEGSSLAYDYWTGQIIEVPFEIWSLGRGTPDDRSDDYRMVPFVIDHDENGFGLSTMDHIVSDGDDDPELDAIYLREPVDMSAGEAGYDIWHTAMDQNRAEPEITDEVVGPERIARIAFVNWDAGQAGSNDIEQEVPEPGTIFRISTRPRPAPILNAPATDAVMTTENAVFQWTVFPEEPVTFEAARDASFEDVVLRVEVPGETLGASALPNLSPGRYYWRVTAEKAGTSEIGSYLVGTAVEAEASVDTAVPEIVSVYPAPAADRARILIRMPSPIRAGLSVYDVLGRRVFSDTMTLEAGTSTITIPTDRLAPGSYFIRIDANTDRLTARLLVARP